MATWLALSGGIWVKGRRVVACCCRRRWRACCRFWALFRLDFFIVTRLLQGSIVLAIPLVSMLPRSHGHGEYTCMVSGAAWAYRHAGMIRLNVLRRHFLLSSLTGGNV